MFYVISRKLVGGGSYSSEEMQLVCFTVPAGMVIALFGQPVKEKGKSIQTALLRLKIDVVSYLVLC